MPSSANQKEPQAPEPVNTGERMATNCSWPLPRLTHTPGVDDRIWLACSTPGCSRVSRSTTWLSEAVSLSSRWPRSPYTTTVCTRSDALADPLTPAAAPQQINSPMPSRQRRLMIWARADKWRRWNAAPPHRDNHRVHSPHREYDHGLEKAAHPPPPCHPLCAPDAFAPSLNCRPAGDCASWGNGRPYKNRPQNPRWMAPNNAGAAPCPLYAFRW